MAYIPPKDAPPPFDMDWLNEQLDEARERVRVQALPYPGIWKWCKEHRTDLYNRLDFYVLAYKESFEGKIAAACCKWLFMAEVTAKKIIAEYSKVAKTR